jgi:hypothetical protein
MVDSATPLGSRGGVRMCYPQVTSLWSDYPRLLLKCVPFRDYLVMRSVNSVRDNTREASKKICVNPTSDFLRSKRANR